MDPYLVPTLSSRIDIRSYSEKLHNYATHFSAWDKDYPVGIALCYFNKPEEGVGYISSFSVRNEYQKKGIAGNLIKKVTKYAKEEHFSKISLEVNKSNMNAIKFYEKYGFKPIYRDATDQFFSMILILKYGVGIFV